MEDDTTEMTLDSSSSCSHFYEVSWESPIKEVPVLVGQLYYDRTSKSLTMINKNTCLHRRCLLLGYTSKKEEGGDRRSSIIGQFGVWLICIQYILILFLLHVTGEGMKVGALALLRNKCKVCVRTSCDSWSFGLKKHAILQEEVLTVFVSSKSIT